MAASIAELAAWKLRLQGELSAQFAVLDDPDVTDLLMASLRADDDAVCSAAAECIYAAFPSPYAARKLLEHGVLPALQQYMQHHAADATTQLMQSLRWWRAVLATPGLPWQASAVIRAKLFALVSQVTAEMFVSDECHDELCALCEGYAADVESDQGPPLEARDQHGVGIGAIPDEEALHLIHRPLE